MKVYVIKDEDIESLLTSLDRDPKHGRRGGASTCLSEAEKEAFDLAHRFYNYQVRMWIDRVRG